MTESDCSDHDYEFQEFLPAECSTEVYQELWVCIHCGHEKVLTHHIGVRD